MPTRPQKGDAHCRWLVIFERPEGKRLQRVLHRRCAKARHLRLIETGSNSAKVEWAKAVKWDGAVAWFSRNLNLPKGRFGLQPLCTFSNCEVLGAAAEGTPEFPKAPTGETKGMPDWARQSCQTLQTSALPSARACVSEARATGADSATARATYLQFKLMHTTFEVKDANELEVDEQLFEREFEVHLAEELGEGAYGKVVVGTQRATGDKVAMKFFRSSADALFEVTAHSCLEPHPHIASLLDVGISRTSVALVSARFQMDLSSYIKRSKAAPEMTQHILRCICEGLLHTHRSGLVHNDLKPSNVFLNLPEDADAVWESSPPKLAQWLSQLPVARRVVSGDFGCAVPGDPNDRRRGLDRNLCAGRRWINGVEQATLWYRAPESLMGCASFSYPVDVWALGCVGAELFSGAVLFEGAGQIIVLHKIFRLFGKPSAARFPKKDYPLFPK